MARLVATVARSRRAASAYTRRGVAGSPATGMRPAEIALLRQKQVALAEINLHYGQTLAWQAREDGHQIISIFAGTGGGKTWYGIRHFYPLLREHLDRTYLFTEPTWRMIKRVLLPSIIPFLDTFIQGRMHYGDMTYELPGGGRILFGSVDNPESLQGVHIDGGIWADEIGLYSEDAWDTLLQRRTLYRAPVLNTSTPYSLPWCERRLAKPANDPADSHIYRMIQFPSYWNPQYPRDEYFRLKRSWPKDKFDRLMRGQFTRVGGLCFEEFDEQRNLATIYLRREGEALKLYFSHPTEGKRVVEIVRTWCAQDWGWSPDPGVQLLFAQDGLGRIYVVEEDYDTRIPVERGTGDGGDTWVARGLRRLQRFGIDAIYCDPSLPGNIDDFVQWGLPATRATANVAFGLDEVNQAFLPRGDGSSGLYIAVNGCPNLVRTIGSYVLQRDPHSENYLRSPAPNQDDHAEDCLRYGIAQDSKPDKRGIGLGPVLLSGGSGRRGKGK